jgi:hypothetical protein
VHLGSRADPCGFRNQTCNCAASFAISADAPGEQVIDQRFIAKGRVAA